MAELKHFLLVYDRTSDQLRENSEFHDVNEATTAYENAEALARESDLDLDVVLVGSDSIETVQITHSNYFDGNAMRRVQEALAV